MKRIKMSLALVAVLAGSVAAMAFKPAHHFTAPNYYNTGTMASPTWNVLTRSLGTIDDPGTYRCDAASNYCTAFFSSPPSAHQIPTDDELGKYVENN